MRLMLQRLPGMGRRPEQSDQQCQLPRRPATGDADCGCAKQEFTQCGHPESRQSSAEHPQGLELEHILKVMLHRRHHVLVSLSTSDSIVTATVFFPLSHLTDSYVSVNR